MSQRGLPLVTGEVVRDLSQHSPGCHPTTPKYANLEAGGGTEMPVVPNTSVSAASAYDQAYRIS